jgi:ATP-dependent phosphoenolpyruvate carboxykinase
MLPDGRDGNRNNILTIHLQVWRINRERAVDYLNTRNRIYVIDGFAGWDERYRINVRVVCARAYHALFMRNMLIRPSRKELEHFHPDYVIYNAGAFPANRWTTGMTSATSVSINFAEKEMVILGTEYAGEMKKACNTPSTLLFAANTNKLIGYFHRSLLRDAYQARRPHPPLLRQRGPERRRYRFLRSLRHWQDNPLCRPQACLDR